MWHSMAYSVAKELSLRPMEILRGWACEELLVTYGIYANQNSAVNYEMLTPKERARKQMTPLDRWATPFVTEEQAHNLAQEQKKEEQERREQTDIVNALVG